MPDSHVAHDSHDVQHDEVGVYGRHVSGAGFFVLSRKG
jgi:hypothetical protein